MYKDIWYTANNQSDCLITFEMKKKKLLTVKPMRIDYSRSRNKKIRVKNWQVEAKKKKNAENAFSFKCQPPPTRFCFFQLSGFLRLKSSRYLRLFVAFAIFAIFFFFLIFWILYSARLHLFYLIKYLKRFKYFYDSRFYSFHSHSGWPFSIDKK